MIDIDINVPYLGKKYDFHVDETVPIKLLIDSIVEMICNAEHLSNTQCNRFILFFPGRKQMLIEEETLESYGVKAGDSLLLC